MHVRLGRESCCVRGDVVAEFANPALRAMCKGPLGARGAARRRVRVRAVRGHRLHQPIDAEPRQPALGVDRRQPHRRHLHGRRGHLPLHLEHHDIRPHRGQPVVQFRPNRRHPVPALRRFGLRRRRHHLRHRRRRRHDPQRGAHHRHGDGRAGALGQRLEGKRCAHRGRRKRHLHCGVGEPAHWRRHGRRHQRQRRGGGGQRRDAADAHAHVHHAELEHRADGHRRAGGRQLGRGGRAGAGGPRRHRRRLHGHHRRGARHCGRRRADRHGPRRGQRPPHRDRLAGQAERGALGLGRRWRGVHRQRDELRRGLRGHGGDGVHGLPGRRRGRGRRLRRLRAHGGSQLRHGWRRRRGRGRSELLRQLDSHRQAGRRFEHRRALLRHDLSRQRTHHLQRESESTQRLLRRFLLARGERWPGDRAGAGQSGHLRQRRRAHRRLGRHKPRHDRRLLRLGRPRAERRPRLDGQHGRFRGTQQSRHDRQQLRQRHPSARRKRRHQCLHGWLRVRQRQRHDTGQLRRRDALRAFRRPQVPRRREPLPTNRHGHLLGQHGGLPDREPLPSQLRRKPVHDELAGTAGLQGHIRQLE